MLLKTVTDLPDGVLFSKDGKTLIAYPVQKTGNYTIPNSVTEIGDHAFDDCTGLTSVEIPDSVGAIGGGAFDHYSSLTSIDIPASVIRIIGQAFSGCTALTALHVDNGNSNYASIDGVLFTKDEKTLLSYSQGKTGAYTVPAGVTEIDNYAFEHCNGLTAIHIPKSVTAIGYWDLERNPYTSVQHEETTV